MKLPADEIQLLRTVQIQAPRSGVYVSSSRPVPNMSGKTNAFFDEQTVVISVNTGDKELVSFLYTIGSDNSMIRVRDLDLKPDTSGNKLQGSLTLVASFQRKPPTVAPAVASKTNNATVTRPQATNSQRSTGPRTNNLVAPKPMR